MENQKHIEAYQDLFDYLHDEHDLILLQSEMDEIIELSANAVRKYNEASEGSKQPDTEANDNKHAVIKSVCECKSPAYRDQFGDHRCAKCNALINY